MLYFIFVLFGVVLVLALKDCMHANGEKEKVNLFLDKTFCFHCIYDESVSVAE